MSRTNRWWLVLAAVLFQMSLVRSLCLERFFALRYRKKMDGPYRRLPMRSPSDGSFSEARRVVGGLWLKRRHPPCSCHNWWNSVGAPESFWPLLRSTGYGGFISTYGVIGGMGLGMGYIVPIAFLVKWFPDRARTHCGAGGRWIWSGISLSPLQSLIDSLSTWGSRPHFHVPGHRLCDCCYGPPLLS